MCRCTDWSSAGVVPVSATLVDRSASRVGRQRPWGLVGLVCDESREKVESFG